MKPGVSRGKCLQVCQMGHEINMGLRIEHYHSVDADGKSIMCIDSTVSGHAWELDDIEPKPI